MSKYMKNEYSGGFSTFDAQDDASAIKKARGESIPSSVSQAIEDTGEGSPWSLDKWDEKEMKWKPVC